MLLLGLISGIAGIVVLVVVLAKLLDDETIHGGMKTFVISTLALSASSFYYEYKSPTIDIYVDVPILAEVGTTYEYDLRSYSCIVMVNKIHKVISTWPMTLSDSKTSTLVGGCITSRGTIEEASKVSDCIKYEGCPKLSMLNKVFKKTFLWDDEYFNIGDGYEEIGR